MRGITGISMTIVTALVVAACGSDSTGGGTEGGDLVIRGSGSATATTLAELNVDPASFTVGIYQFLIAANADCTGPYTTLFSGTTARTFNLTSNPEIVHATGVATGSYSCVAMRLSDLIGYSPVSTEGNCIGGTDYTHDFYRAGNEPVPFRDLDGNPITATGTDAVPSEDPVWVFFSTNPAAVSGRGYSVNQVVQLSGSLEVPGATTFYWDGANSIHPDGTRCEITPNMVGFR